MDSEWTRTCGSIAAQHGVSIRVVPRRVFSPSSLMIQEMAGFLLPAAAGWEADASRRADVHEHNQLDRTTESNRMKIRVVP